MAGSWAICRGRDEDRTGLDVIAGETVCLYNRCGSVAR